ncbi:hypothetical protein ACVSUJ_15550 [Yersinia enterocolitica]|uniref:hypothetical protein n=1 Tax=Yersinia enterocolitica TaxID=630 RepID=UPI001C8E8A22|nr:hypothetical protein [Yersinia enterocolitica]MBX9473553.1 hypothetical protein [Yersinia enterocolitica]
MLVLAIVAFGLKNCDVAVNSIFQKPTTDDDDTANYAVLAIREISFTSINALDNYYHLDIIKGKKVAVDFQG